MDTSLKAREHYTLPSLPTAVTPSLLAELCCLVTDQQATHNRRPYIQCCENDHSPHSTPLFPSSPFICPSLRPPLHTYPMLRDASSEALLLKANDSLALPKFPSLLSFPVVSFLLSTAFCLLTLTFALLCLALGCIIVGRSVMYGYPPTIVSLLLLLSLWADLVYSLFYLHHASTSHSRRTFAAYFRVRCFSLARLLSPSPFNRLLYCHWYSQHRLRSHLGLDLLSLVCMAPAYSLTYITDPDVGPFWLSPSWLGPSSLTEPLKGGLRWVMQTAMMALMAECLLELLSRWRERVRQEGMVQQRGMGQQPHWRGGEWWKVAIRGQGMGQSEVVGQQEQVGYAQWDAPPAYEERAQPFIPQGPAREAVPSFVQSERKEGEEVGGAGARHEGERQGKEEGKRETKEEQQKPEGGGQQGESGMTAPTVLMSPSEEGNRPDPSSHSPRIQPPSSFVPRVVLDI